MANKRTETSKSIVKASAVHEKGVCDLCCHETKDWVLGQCDHPTCLRCSTKLRLLCGQKECPVCREPLKKVRQYNIIIIKGGGIGVCLVRIGINVLPS